MLLEFIATIAIGFGAAGCVLIFDWVLGGRLARWLVPAAAGLGMIGFVIWSEYSWAGRVMDGLPDTVEVVSRNESTAWFRPWTYVWPVTNRMIAVDHRFTRPNPNAPELIMTRVTLIGRWEPIRPIPVVYDCAEGRRADLSADVAFTEEGALEGADWLALPPDDPALRAACERR